MFYLWLYNLIKKYFSWPLYGYIFISMLNTNHEMQDNLVVCICSLKCYILAAFAQI